MKKKCFNDKYGQTESVLNGTKTMFREIFNPHANNRGYCMGVIVGLCYVKYKVGEVVAVAQSYKDAGYLENWNYDGDIPNDEKYDPEWRPDFCRNYGKVKGWTNKLFVKADLMPHQIKITGIKLEKLQNISEEDCFKEGIRHDESLLKEILLPYFYSLKTDRHTFSSPRKAFAHLINEATKRGTWEQNPYVIAYEFELIK